MRDSFIHKTPIVLRSSLLSRLGMLLLSVLLGTFTIIYIVIEGGSLILFDLFFAPLFLVISYATWATWYEVTFYDDHCLIRRGPQVREVLYQDIAGIDYRLGLRRISVYTTSGKYRIDLYVQKAEQIQFDRLMQQLVPAVRHDLTLQLPYDLRYERVWLGHGFLAVCTAVVLFLSYYVPVHLGEFDLWALASAIFISGLLVWVVTTGVFRTPVRILFAQDTITIYRRIGTTTYAAGQLGRPVVKKETVVTMHGWHSYISMGFTLGKEKISISETVVPIPLTALEKFMLENYFEKK